MLELEVIYKKSRGFPSSQRVPPLHSILSPQLSTLLVLGPLTQEVVKKVKEGKLIRKLEREGKII